MNTHESYVSLEIAKMLKEAGFDWKCNGVFFSQTGTHYIFTKLYVAWDNNNDKHNKYNISAPTLEVVQRWLREVKGMCLTIQPLLDKVNGQCNVVVGFTPFIHRMDGKMIIVPLDSEHTYEEALEAGEQKALQICLEQDKKSE